MAKLILEDGKTFEGKSFGANVSSAGEMVFATGMTGYPESFTDPSYRGQILILTYPIIGNYGIPDEKYWESNRMHITGLIVSTYNDTPSHFQSKKTLGEWLKESRVPALEIADTRLLAQTLRDKGAMLGKIVIDKNLPFYDPNKDNLVEQVATKKITEEGSGNKTIVLLDCGLKRNIVRELVKRNVRVRIVPWDHNLFSHEQYFNAIVVSNGPGDPKMADRTIEMVKKALVRKIPILGICLGNQILALAAGGDTVKLKFGHRSQNQPALLVETNRCYITTQNHGFYVRKIPKGFREWFRNSNDGSNEGLIHEKLPFMSVQFHPDSTPGPYDTEWIFDFFLKKI
jgi:carbamoyl-phosphate synthase small subunit